MNQKLGTVILRWVEVIQLMFFFLHRTSGEITKEFVTAFCESFNKFFPDFGREQSEFAFAQFLHPFTKGSGLTFDNKVHKYQSIVDRICDMLKPTAKEEEEENQSIIGVRRPSQVTSSAWDVDTLIPVCENMVPTRTVAKRSHSEIDFFYRRATYTKIEDANVLDYWKGYSDHMPRLASLARRIYNIPLGSVTSYMGSSTAEIVLTESTTLLDSDRAEENIYCKENYFRAQCYRTFFVRNLQTFVLRYNVLD